MLADVLLATACGVGDLHKGGERNVERSALDGRLKTVAQVETEVYVGLRPLRGFGAVHALSTF